MAVYFIRAVESDRIKVGFTDQPIYKRLCCLQTAAPEPLELLHVCQSGTREDERKLHKRFKRFRVNGEWFINSIEITVLIRVLQKNIEKERFFIHQYPCNAIETLEFNQIRKEGNKMPARVVDGNSLWRSNKLKKVSQSYRAEYANLIPLAEANGVFDADPERVWSDVYAFNRPEVTLEMVEEILDEFEEADLLRRWNVKGKLWGFWVGINKSGRLPTEAHMKRYKNLPPNPPPDIFTSEIPSRISPGLSGSDPGESGIHPVRFGIGLDRNGIGLDREEAENIETIFQDAEIQIPETGQENTLKAKKEIPFISRKILGVRAEIWDSTWAEIKELERIYGSTEVCSAFEDWAKTKVGEIKDKPVSEFLKIADGLLMGTFTLSADPTLTSLIDDLVYATRGEVTFNDGQKFSIGRLLETYTSEEILRSGKEFYATVKDDAFKLKNAAGNFVQQAEQLIKFARREKAEKEQEASAVDSAKEKMQREAEEDRIARQKARDAEDSLVEDVLGD